MSTLWAKIRIFIGPYCVLNVPGYRVTASSMRITTAAYEITPMCLVIRSRIPNKVKTIL